MMIKENDTKIDSPLCGFQVQCKEYLTCGHLSSHLELVIQRELCRFTIKIRVELCSSVAQFLVSF
jgi:hypothetical protein